MVTALPKPLFAIRNLSVRMNLMRLKVVNFMDLNANLGMVKGMCLVTMIALYVPCLNFKIVIADDAKMKTTGGVMMDGVLKKLDSMMASLTVPTAVMKSQVLDDPVNPSIFIFIFEIFFIGSLVFFASRFWLLVKVQVKMSFMFCVVLVMNLSLISALYFRFNQVVDPIHLCHHLVWIRCVSFLHCQSD